MSISFANSAGNLFNILGKDGALVKNMISYQGEQNTSFVNASTGLTAQLTSANFQDINSLVGSSYIGQLNTPSQIGSLAQNVGQQVINRFVYLDNPRVSQNLQSLQLNTSIQEVIRQMKAQGATILAMTIGVTPSAPTGNGNGVALASVKRPLDGLVLENSFAETLLLTCSKDSYTGGTSAGNESFILTGTGSATSSPFGFDWPKGSNSKINLSTINSNANNSQGNLLTNSNFANFTSNAPNNFTIATGASTITKETSLVYANSTALRITGDGSTLTSFNQKFSTTTGTTANLFPLNQYGFNIFLRTMGTAPTQGVLRISLIDQNNNIINDANGVANSFTINLTGLTTTYTAYNGTFRTPIILPTSQFVRYDLTTAINSGAIAILANSSMGLMTQAYTSGPWVAIFAGSIPFTSSGSQPDFITIVVTNSRGSGGTLSTFQTLLYQLFFPNVGTQEFLFPSSSSPSLSDGLIA